MELNKAQLLVQNDATLNKFRADHGIPDDVQQNGLISMRMPIWLRKQGSNSNSDLADPSSWASVSHKPDAEGSNGTLSPHLHASVNEFCLDRACGGHIDAPSRALL